MDLEATHPGQTVLVRGDRIVALGPASEVAVPEGTAVIDGRGCYLVPGLTDAHVHLDSHVGARPDFGDAPLFLAHGVTTVFNLRGDQRHLDWKLRIREGSLAAPNLYTSGEFVNEPRDNTLDEVERDVLDQASTGYDIIKFHQVFDDRTGRYLTTKGLQLPAYLRMNSAARRARIPLLGHAPVNLGLDALLQARKSLSHVGEFVPLHFLPAPHLVEHGLAAAVRKDWRNAGPALPTWLAAFVGHYPGFTRKVAAALHRRGVPLMAGTDTLGFPLIIPGVSLHQELRLLTECGLTPFEALRAATAAPAEFLGKQGEFGTIAVGKRADLLLVDGNPLRDITRLEQPIGVMVRGTWFERQKLQGMMAALAGKE